MTTVTVEECLASEKLWREVFKEYGTQLLSENSKIASARLGARCLVKTGLVREAEECGEKVLYCYHHQIGCYIPLEYLSETVAAMTIDITDVNTDIGTLARKIENWLNHLPVPPLNLPPKHYVLFQNGVVDVTTGEFVPEEVASQYDYTSKHSYRFGAELSPVTETILNQIFYGWADGRKDVYDVITHYLRNAMEMNNREKALILYGSGGNGKSAYIQLARKLAGGNPHVTNLNLQELSNPYQLHQIANHTKLVAGEDAVLDTNAFHVTKALIVGHPLNIPVKYKGDRTLVTRLSVIQAVDIPLRVNERKNALRAGFVYIPWTSTDFRKLKETDQLDFDLNALLKSSQFIEETIAYIFKVTEHRRSLRIPPKL